MAIVIIAGSRTITDISEVYTAVNMSGLMSPITEIVSGAARGVDKLGELFAAQQGIPLKLFPADWDAYGKSAGFRRNAEMANYADYLISVWDGKSKGSQHMIMCMKQRGKPYFIHRVFNV